MSDTDERIREPYDFVRYPNSNSVDRGSAAGHHNFKGRSGRIECELKSLSPFLIMHSEHRAGSSRTEKGTFMRSAETGDYIIPGTSLKGLVRSTFEVLYPSCTATYGYDTGRLIPRGFNACSSRKNACPACRTFGFLSGGTVHKGQVNIGTARAVEQPPSDGAQQLIALFGPNPDTAKYSNGGDAAGRKFYFHQSSVQNALSSNDEKYGPWVQPLDKGARFQFTVDFENLTDKELNALVAALVLADDVTVDDTGDTVDVRHKLGYGKPAGLGSVAIRITEITLRPNARDAYASFGASPTVMTEGSDDLDAWVNQRQQLLFGNPTASVKDLMRILRYPAPEDVRYEYDKGAFG